MTLLEQTRKARGFKAYCQRRINGHSLTHAERLNLANKSFWAKFRAFCKPRGINSILKDQFYDIGDGTLATLKKVNGEFISVLPAVEVAEAA